MQVQCEVLEGSGADAFKFQRVPMFFIAQAFNFDGIGT